MCPQSLLRVYQYFRSRLLPQPLLTEQLQTGDVGQLLVPVDWPFLPLVELYNSSQTTDSNHLSAGYAFLFATFTLHL